MEWRKLRLNVSIFLLQLLALPTPCGDGQLAVLKIRFQLALCHVEHPQLVIVFRFVLLPGFLKADGFQLIRSGLARLVIVHHAQQFIHLLDVGLLCRCRFFQSIDLVLHGVKRVFQIVHGVKIFGLQEAERLCISLQIGVLCLGAVRALATIGAMQRQQIVEHGRLWLGELGFYVPEPANQRGDLFLCLPHQRVDFPNEAVEIALVGTDALCLHRPDGGTFMLRGDLLHALTGKAAVVNATV